MAVSSEVNRETVEFIINPVYQVSTFIKEDTGMYIGYVENVVESVIIIFL